MTPMTTDAMSLILIVLPRIAVSLAYRFFQTE